MFGAVTPTAAASEIVVNELMTTELLPVTFAPSATEDPAAVFAVSVMSFPVIKPLVLMLAPLAFKVNAAPAPELLAFNVTVVAAVSVMDTVPVDVAVNVVAFIEFGAAKLMPPVPELTLTVAEFRAPVALMPPAAFEALRLKELPELAPN